MALWPWPLTRSRGTYMAGMIDSVQLLKVGRKSVDFLSHIWWPDVPKIHQIAQICTYILENLCRCNKLSCKPKAPSPDLLPLDERPPSHFFRASTARAFDILTRVVYDYWLSMIGQFFYEMRSVLPLKIGCCLLECVAHYVSKLYWYWYPSVFWP